MVVKKPKKALSLKETKPSFSRTQPQSLNNQEASANNESQFWIEVAEKSENLIANLIEKVLPISATPQSFDLEKDADYRMLLREDLPNSYQDDEEYLEKVASGNWTEEDVEYASQELVCAYWEIVAKALADWLSEYPNFESTNLSSLKE